MNIEICGYTKRSFSAVSISHGNEHTLVMSAAGYSTTKPGAVRLGDDDVLHVSLFDEVNEFIGKMSKVDQQALYECYARVDGIFTAEEFTLGGQNALNLKLDVLLTDIVNSIYSIIKFDDLRNYIVGKPKLKLPPELSDTYVTDDKITPLYMQRTYLLSEYIDLVALTFGLRFMIPIWGQYLPISSKEHGSTMMEYYAFQLIAESTFFQADAFHRMETYIRANLPEEASTDMGVLLKFLSSEEIPTYLIALATIRKLSVAPLSADNNDTDHLMKIIYNYAFGNNKQLAGALGSKVTSKTNPGESLDDNSSVWGVFKMKEQISKGELVMFQIYVMNFVKCAQAIEPDINPDIVERCVTRALKLQDFNPSESQIGLIVWTLSPVVPGCVIEMFDRQTLFTAMGLAQAILWHWGLIQLAALLTARRIELEEGEIMAPVPYGGVSRKNLEALEIVYPYSLPVSRNGDHLTEPNPGLRGIECIVSDMFKNYWEPTCIAKLAKAADCDVIRQIEVSSDVRDQLATLLIKLNEHTR